MGDEWREVSEDEKCGTRSKGEKLFRPGKSFFVRKRKRLPPHSEPKNVSSPVVPNHIEAAPGQQGLCGRCIGQEDTFFTMSRTCDNRT